jgi:gliding motility-associated-like protein
MAMNVNAVPVLAPITGVTSLCLGSTTTLNNAQTSGTWSSSNVAIATVAANGVVTGLSAGTATIFYTYTNASGCASSVSAQVTVNALPSGVITANGPTTFCQGGSVELVAPVAASYSWSNGSATSSIIVNNSGSYDLTITDANGCTGSVAPMIVTVNALPNATIVSSGSNVCLGSTVTLTASGGIAYSWSNNATTAAINVVAANNYVVTVTDANGCVNTASETVVFNANPAVTLTANGPTVFCQGGSVTVTATGGNNYVWSNGTLGATASFNQSGNYYVMVTNAAGCTTQSSIVHVTVNTVPVVAAITGSNSVCEGGNMTLSSATIGGTWTVNNNFIANIDGAGNVTGLNAGTTTVTYTVSNNGCTASAVAQVNVLNNPVTPTITASGATSLCPGGSVVLFASNAPNYQWSNGPTTPFVVASQSGAYTVTVTGLNGCSATSLPVNVFIGDNTNPVITAPLNVTVTPNLGCEAVGVTLGSPVTSDNCSVASVTNDAPAIYPIGTTTVTWTVTDGSGNVATATQLVTVTDQTAPTAYAPANVTVSSNANCEATGVQLGTPIATDNCTNNLVVTNNAPTTYPLGNTTVTWTITDAAGNVTTVDQTVTVVDQTAPVVLLANTSIILDANGNGTIDFTALDNGSYDNCGIASAEVSQTAFDCSHVGKNFVTVTLTDNSGNQASAQIMVTVIASDACGGSNWSGPVVPDAFTPNGNNYNDTWVIPGLEGYNTKEMAVYSRYGTLVYYNTQYNNDWDGTLLNTGTQVPDGTYYYILNLDGGKQLNGYVYINRVKQ